MDKTALEALVRQVLLERLGGGTHGVKAVQVPRIAVTEEHRMDTGNPLDRVYTRDLFTLQESPRLGVGVMEMTDTTFPWTLRYDAVSYTHLVRHAEAGGVLRRHVNVALGHNQAAAQAEHPVPVAEGEARGALRIAGEAHRRGEPQGLSLIHI